MSKRKYNLRIDARDPAEALLHRILESTKPYRRQATLRGLMRAGFGALIDAGALPPKFKIAHLRDHCDQPPIFALDDTTYPAPRRMTLYFRSHDPVELAIGTYLQGEVRKEVAVRQLINVGLLVALLNDHLPASIKSQITPETAAALKRGAMVSPKETRRAPRPDDVPETPVASPEPVSEPARALDSEPEPEPQPESGHDRNAEARSRLSQLM